MKNKITESTINKIQDHLKDYIMEHSSKNKNRKFTCFNKNAHSHKDQDPSAAIVPGSSGRYWNCFGCGAKGDILSESSYNEGIDGFQNGNYVASLRSANIVILPDNDESGKAYANDVLRVIKNEVKSIKIINLPGLKLKEDIVDWVGNGGTLEELITLVNTADETVESEVVQNKPIGNIYENEFCYYKYYKKQIINISNFIINPKYYIENEGDTQIVGNIITEEGIIGERTFKTSDFDDVLSFRRALNSFKTFYIGRVEDLQYIRFIISSKTSDTRKGVCFSGFHKLNNQWCFVTEHGALNSEGKPTLDIAMQNQYAELNTNILKNDVITKEELLEVAPYLFKFSILKNTAAILGYVCGLFLKEKLKHNKIQYNHLLIEGESSSGKSSAVKYIITPILCMEDGILNAAQCTDFALNKTASSSNFIPLILEEYKPHIIGKNKVDLISGVMRNSYDNYKGIKGVATLDKNRTFIPRASVILSGEAGIEETANVGRSLRVIFATSYFDEETKESLEKLKENSILLNKLGASLLKEALKMEEDKIKEIHSAIFEKAISNNIKNDRVKNSIANCMIGIALLKRVFNNLDLNMQECTGFTMKEIISSIETGAYEDLLDGGTSNKTVIEQNFETMNRMAANNELYRNIDYDAVLDLDGDFVLRLNYTCFYDRFVKYCREHNVTHEVLPLSSFKKQLSNMQYCKSYNKPVNFSVRQENPKNKKTFRCAVVYINKLREKNVDVDFIADDNMID
ncbi:hypothetical protein KPL37_13850 [Clostridium frigoris]|uniref:DNA primase n=1 Tax=Clostridium frigoris TaxID=205327 RepID=A0ABS6BWF6_9CLOT|nr:hypothetical protein [Clostridium frigoris]MBU3160825.1 hypothetical protein [Clostridium frigoris]